MTKEIKQTWQFAQSADIIWRYLTEPDLLERWLMRNTIKAEAGYEFNFFTQAYPQSGFDGVVHCKIIELVPMEKLSYTWKGGPGNGEYTLDTTVTWTLVRKDGGTELTLEHKGFKDPENMLTFNIMSEGWSKHVYQRLSALINA